MIRSASAHRNLSFHSRRSLPKRLRKKKTRSHAVESDFSRTAKNSKRGQLPLSQEPPAKEEKKDTKADSQKSDGYKVKSVKVENKDCMELLRVCD